ncbi:MAG TPA: NUDIX hydrolase [Longimicrobium sp.]|nr:NUDIX hydrolase [Longimicrobium sp.]
MSDDARTSSGEAPGRISRRTVHQGRIVDLGIDTVRFPNGSTGELEMIRHSGAAAVLPVLSDPSGGDPQVVLVKQYRYASGGWLYEVPAGRPDHPGEPWEEVAKRELLEEAGLVAGELTFLTEIWTTPGFTDEKIRLYLATNLSAGETSYDEDEFMELVRVPLSEALRMVRDREITDAKSICTLLYAAGFVLGM